MGAYDWFAGIEKDDELEGYGLVLFPFPIEGISSTGLRSTEGPYELLWEGLRSKVEGKEFSLLEAV